MAREEALIRPRLSHPPHLLDAEALMFPVVDFPNAKVLEERGDDLLYEIEMTDGTKKEVLIPKQDIWFGPQYVGGVGEISVTRNWAIQAGLVAPRRRQ
jgi:hypothetical protein